MEGIHISTLLHPTESRHGEPSRSDPVGRSRTMMSAPRLSPFDSAQDDEKIAVQRHSCESRNPAIVGQDPCGPDFLSMVSGGQAS